MSGTPRPADGAGVELRPVDPGDAGTTDGLPTPAPDSDGPRWRRSLVAVADGSTIGIGTIALAAATESYFLELTVAADRRGQGVGTRLVAALRELTDPDLPVLGRAMRSQPQRARFLDHLGATPLIHCPMPRLDATDQAVRDWSAGQPTPSGYRIVALDDVDDATARAAWIGYYVWAHRPFGTVREAVVPETWAPLRRGLDAGVSKLCLEAGSGQVVGFSLVSPNAWEGRTFIICETVHPDQPEGLVLLRAVLAAALRDLGAAGTTVIEIEGHSTDRHTPALVDSLPGDACDPMTIYRLPVQQERA